MTVAAPGQIRPPLEPATGELLDRFAQKAQLSRLETVRQIAIAKSGHYGTAFSCAEIFAVLYYDVLRIDPAVPDWPDRDRFVMGKGHAAVGLYPILADRGFFPTEWLDSYARLGSPLGDHPDMRKIPGVDFSSGSLGHGISVSVGMALSARIDRRDFRVFCLLGDGELNEGQVWEAAMSAAHFNLGNLVAIVDRNMVSVDGLTSDVMDPEPIIDKFAAFGWRAITIDGHDERALHETFRHLPDPSDEQPTVIVASTVTGRGVKFMEGDFGWHLGYLAPPDEQRVVAELQAGLAGGRR
jgi:transketolase